MQVNLIDQAITSYGGAKADRVGGLNQSAKGVQDTGKIKKVAEEFESVFLEIVLRSMRNTVDSSGLMSGGNAGEIYQSMLDGEYSKMMSGTHEVGLADSIEKQLLQIMGRAAYQDKKTGG